MSDAERVFWLLAGLSWLFARAAEEPECTGIAATWCPRCGDCTCPFRETLDEEESIEDPACPLHAWESPHAEDGGGEL